MSLSLKIFYSKLTDPFKNLALEESLLASIKPGEKFLLLYKNDPCVVMGRFQNPWFEVNIPDCQESNIQIVRRQSGGGTVFHDMGNLNFCFMHGQRDFAKEENFKIIARALKNFNLDAHIEDDSNLFIKDYKFSGSAFKQKKDRSFHHGTLLIDANLADLTKYITRKNYKIELTKGIRSNPKTVINLSDLNSTINDKTLVQSLSTEYRNFYEDLNCETEYINTFDKKYLEKIVDPLWLWGETPQFNMELAHMHFHVHKNIVQTVDGLIDHTFCGKRFDLVFNELYN